MSPAIEHQPAYKTQAVISDPLFHDKLPPSSEMTRGHIFGMLFLSVEDIICVDFSSPLVAECVYDADTQEFRSS